MKPDNRLIKQWVTKGDHDLGTAKITFMYIPEFLDMVTFHCQQAIEKYLKAYLIHLNIHFRATHDLVYLIDLIVESDKEFEEYYDLMSEIQSYAVEVRYPNETVFLTNDKVKIALISAKKMRDLVTNKMGVDVKYNDVIDQ